MSAVFQNYYNFLKYIKTSSTKVWHHFIISCTHDFSNTLVQLVFSLQKI